VRVPDSSPFVLDVGLSAFAVVRVLDSDGAPAVGHPAAVSGVQGRQVAGETDASGEVRLGPLAEGSYRAFIPLVATKGSWSSDLVEEFALGVGEERVIEFRLPAQGDPARPRLVLLGAGAPTTFEGWRARDTAQGHAWTAVEEDGRVDLEIENGTHTFQVESGGGRRWSVAIPAAASGETPVELRWSGRFFEGTARRHADGAPLARVRVFAAPRGSSEHARVSAVTDGAGHFRLDGLEDLDYVVTFSSQPGTLYREQEPNDFMHLFFYPESRPTEAGSRLDVSLPVFDEGEAAGFGVVTVEGRVLDALGNPVKGAIVAGRSSLPAEGGALTILSLSGWVHSDPAGHYRQRLAATGSITLEYYRELSDDEPLRQDLLLRAGEETVAQDLQLP
jgi:hypothetical protein